MLTLSYRYYSFLLVLITYIQASWPAWSSQNSNNELSFRGNFNAESLVKEKIEIRGNLKVNTIEQCRELTVKGNATISRQYVGKTNQENFIEIHGNAKLNKIKNVTTMQVRGNLNLNGMDNAKKLIAKGHASLIDINVTSMEMFGQLTMKNGRIETLSAKGNACLINSSVTDMQTNGNLTMTNGKINKATISIKEPIHTKYATLATLKDSACIDCLTIQCPSNTIVQLYDTASITTLTFTQSRGYVYCESDKAVVTTINNGEQIDRTKLEELLLNNASSYTNGRGKSKSSVSKWWFPGGKRPLVTYAFIGLALWFIAYFWVQQYMRST